jgi:hypothetical protein
VITATLRTNGTITPLSADAVFRFSGCLVVLLAFVDAALPELIAEQGSEVAVRLKESIEEEMSLTDDVVLQADYHEPLMEQANVLLAVLESRSATSRQVS